jgi:hypothetical protein
MSQGNLQAELKKKHKFRIDTLQFNAVVRSLAKVNTRIKKMRFYLRHQELPLPYLPDAFRVWYLANSSFFLYLYTIFKGNNWFINFLMQTTLTLLHVYCYCICTSVSIKNFIAQCCSRCKGLFPLSDRHSIMVHCIL